MSQTERIHQIVHLLETSRYPVPIDRFLDELEISRATFKRDLDYLRDRLGAPIEWVAGDGGGRGYTLKTTDNNPGNDGLAIRGLWFNQSEIHALLMMHQLASNMDPGLISGQTAGLVTRITHLLGHAEDEPDDVLARVQIVRSASYRKQAIWFEVVAKATMRQKKLEIEYFTRSRGKSNARTVSPKRLLHYRENWYLLAWCHQADGLRLFSIDSISFAQMQKANARRVRTEHLDRYVGDGFGIFGGRARHKARLRFSTERSRWIKDEVWHIGQQSSWDGDNLVLEVPYSNETEIIMEILRHGPDVEVMAPPKLRQRIAELLQLAAQPYRDN
jgi:predicted DNA-binding transcriptional regulator YafY